MSNMLLSPVHSIQRRLAGVKADTPFGMAYQLLLPGYLVRIAGLLMTNTAMNSTCTVGDGLGDMFNKDADVDTCMRVCRRSPLR